MLSLNFAHAGTALKILCLGSHSDDIEIGCGGTILRLLAEGQEVDVTWIVLASNADREREARNSASKFLDRADKKNVVVKTFRDGFFPFEGAQIKNYFEQDLKPISPHLIFTHSRKDAHQDHRLVAELTWNTFRNHLILEYEIPKYDGDMGQPNFFVPLDREMCENKVDYLMEAFGTQRPKAWFAKETFFGLMRLRGMECVAPSGYAEAFYCRKVVI
ncbi:MAG TPA: PIG-L deacetylase family protein [Terriglobales bacterium]|jgi:LmbE family N-acetylglucosaminyl deacetylase|nr:PIG-L deacetylase family protein [Terriglobales bacterium]